MPHRIEPQSTLPTPLPAGSPAVRGGKPIAAAAPAVQPLSVPLGSLALLFAMASVLVAALLGFGLATWLQPVSPWMVGLASAVGVLCTALPLGGALAGLARHAGLAGPPAGHAATAAAGVVRVASTAGSAGSVGSTGAADAGLAHQPIPGAAPRPSGLPQPASPQGLLLDREHFMDMVTREWSRARRYGTGAALLLVEIDRHARLVDALGSVAGDKVLDDLIATTAPTLRGADALARYESGLFAVFLAHADATGALDVAERIRERAEQMEVAVAARRVRFTVSVGVAHLRPAHLHLQALVDDVAEALAAARTVGGNCVRAAPVDVQRPAPGAARDGSRADKS